jgi:hypothetical protein
LLHSLLSTSQAIPALFSRQVSIFVGDLGAAHLSGALSFNPFTHAFIVIFVFTSVCIQGVAGIFIVILGLPISDRPASGSITSSIIEIEFVAL